MLFPIRTIIIGLLAGLLFSCATSEDNESDQNKTTAYFCTAEDLSDDGKHFLDAVGGELEFSNIENRSDEAAFSGKYSIKLYPGQPFGFTTNIPNIKPDTYLKITAWKKSTDDFGVVVADGGGEELYDASKHISEERNGWKKLLLEYYVPPNFFKNKIKVYVWNNGRDTVYFDDLKIEYSREKEYPVYANMPGLQLHVDQFDIDKIRKKRYEAFETTLLFNSDEDFVSTVIYDGNNFLNGKIRLKGDLTDHLQGEKWSFRVKLKNGFSWNHMRTFSVQNPSTRHFLYEWLVHQVFDEEDVLTPGYGLVPLSINNKSLGIYAWEEHFEKQLVESRNRREGPILKCDEEIFWRHLHEVRKRPSNLSVDGFGASRIVPFKANRTIADSSLYLQFNEGQKLLAQYKYRTAPVNEIFDIDKLSRYYALTDIFQAFHGFTWHNQRFYYNPVTCLLEPIAFDGYIEGGIYHRIEERLNGLISLEKLNSLSQMELMQYQVFKDSAFNAKYMQYLDHYSREEQVDKWIENYGTKVDSLSDIIRIEFPAYKFSFDYITEQAAYIRANLSNIEGHLVGVAGALSEKDRQKSKMYFGDEVAENLLPLQVNAYYDKQLKQVKVASYCNLPVKVLGVFVENGLPQSLDNKVELAAYDGLEVPTTEFVVENKPTVLLFSVNNELFETAVSPWPFPEGLSARQKTLRVTGSGTMKMPGDTVVISGILNITRDVLIPSGKIVVIEAGSELNFTDNAGFFSFSPIIARGTKESPVHISSGDHTVNGFNLLQPNGLSSFEHVVFNGLSSLRKGGWQSPAAVNLYEADVVFRNCRFSNNLNCDDALNIVRSNFHISNCDFVNTFADAFDSDFSTGTLEHCKFENTGNDAIDFSGSKVEISNCIMRRIGDKAISGGEKSELDVSDCVVDGANIGIAAKDLSVVRANRMEINDVVYGVVAFVKKFEYGPAKVEVDDLKLKKKLAFHKIEEGSTFVLNGKLIEGREKKLAVKLYQ